jgi:hypothetical protein
MKNIMNDQDRKIYRVDEEIIAMFARAKGQIERREALNSYRRQLALIEIAAARGFLEEKGYNKSQLDSYFDAISSLSDLLLESTTKDVSADKTDEITDAVPESGEISEHLSGQEFASILEEYTNAYHQNLYQRAQEDLTKEEMSQVNEYLEEADAKDNAYLQELENKYVKAAESIFGKSFSEIESEVSAQTVQEKAKEDDTGSDNRQNSNRSDHNSSQDQVDKSQFPPSPVDSYP